MKTVNETNAKNEKVATKKNIASLKVAGKEIKKMLRDCYV